MKQVLECIEPHRRPSRRTIAIDTTTFVGLYALASTPAGPEALRRTALRPRGEDAPTGAMLIAWLTADSSGLVASEVAPRVVFELERATTRRQVMSGMRLPVTGLYEFTLPDGTRGSIGLGLQRRLDRGGSISVAGSGTRRSRAVGSSDDGWWVLTEAPDLLSMGATLAYNAFLDFFKRLGINQEVMTFLVGVLLSSATLGYVAYAQYSAANAADARASEAEASLALAESAQGASLATEMSCLDDRQSLVAELGRKNEAKALQAEEAVALPQARQNALQLGGVRMSTPAVRKLDAMLEPTLIASVQAQMATVSPDADPAPCLAQDAALGSDLPRYLLLWQSDPKLTCPMGYTAEEGGVRRLGRWGLSDRLAREYGSSGHSGTGTTPEAIEGLVSDPRLEDRWSSFTLVAAYRDILEALLRTKRTDRPPTLPAQSQLWALALLDAFNRVPSPADGVLDVPASTCVDRALVEIAGGAQPAAPGTPLMPDLTAVAVGAVTVALTPTPGCAWPSDALVSGTKAALQSAARLAVLDKKKPAGDSAP